MWSPLIFICELVNFKALVQFCFSPKVCVCLWLSVCVLKLVNNQSGSKKAPQNYRSIIG